VDVIDDAGNDSFLRDGIGVFAKNRMAMVGLILVGLLVFVALFIPFISPTIPIAWPWTNNSCHPPPRFGWEQTTLAGIC
jgi:peptide/nickel transport system permease protein/oligopeptide transport system permease protein